MLNRWTRLGARARAVSQQQMRRKATSTPASDAPKEPTTSKIWIVDQIGMWPVIVITAMTVTYGIYQMRQSSTNPAYHFKRDDRKKMEYLENEGNLDKAVEWSASALAAGPDYVHKKNPYKKDSDFKP